ncbi:recombinase family protein [Acidovorax sp. SUPP1855]|uniref:recombinase family protein n=1 Tax=Acidovorax sp. SUPP1855 TaxID=431774 RepID=UPI0023DE430F|nr:recombinase family protein [Acidovorax sp. SUPP1855]GKS83044.1 recombinase family protein [Acidovorax sp. SUPP1855]
MQQQRGRLVGYARVSTKDQETRLQLDALERAGVQEVYQEKASGVSHRPVLRQCLASMQSGDVFVFWRLDRVARSLFDLLAIHDDLQARGVMLRSLSEPFDTTTAWGVCAFQTLGAFAQLERSTIRERVIAGQVAAMRAGVQFGRPRIVAGELALTAARMFSDGLAKAEIARRLGVSQATVRRSLMDLQGVPRKVYKPRYIRDLVNQI